MALIQCPECGGFISDKSIHCMHCRYPLNEINDQNNAEQGKVICKINGEEYDFSDIQLMIDNNSFNFDNGYKYILNNIVPIPLAASEISASIVRDGRIPKEYNTKYYLQSIKRDEQLRCPKCGSGHITTGARGVNWKLGLIGASSTVNRCANCGHTWKPKG